MSAGRVRWTALVAGLLVLALASSCTGPRHEAGARALGPQVGPCYDAPLGPHSMWADGTPAVPCTEPHRAETYHTGTLPGPGSSAHVPPVSREMFDLFATCEERAREFLGAPWYSGWVQIQLTLPRPDPAAADVRTYSCEVFEVDQIGPETVVRRTSSLRGALAARGPLSMGCVAQRNPPARAPMIRAACDQPHEAEYVGGYAADLPAGLPDQEQIDLVADRRCAPGVHAYVRAFRTEILRGFTGWGPAYWEVGQRTMRCFAVAQPGKRFTASVKGLGDRAPPTV